MGPEIVFSSKEVVHVLPTEASSTLELKESCLRSPTLPFARFRGQRIRGKSLGLGKGPLGGCRGDG